MFLCYYRNCCFDFLLEIIVRNSQGRPVKVLDELDRAHLEAVNQYSQLTKHVYSRERKGSTPLHRQVYPGSGIEECIERSIQGDLGWRVRPRRSKEERTNQRKYQTILSSAEVLRCQLLHALVCLIPSHRI